MDLRVDHFKGFMLVKSEHRGQPGRVAQYARIESNAALVQRGQVSAEEGEEESPADDVSEHPEPEMKPSEDSDLEASIKEYCAGTERIMLKLLRENASLRAENQRLRHQMLAWGTR